MINIPTQEQIKERDRLLASQYFLVKMAGEGEVPRCRGCGGKHRYLTLGCIEQPFSGLTHGVYAYWYSMGASGAVHYLSFKQRIQYDRMSKLFKGRDLASSHPQMAAKLGLSEGDAIMGGLALGVLEPISKRVAQQLQTRINSKGIWPPLRLPGLEA